ncbi:FAD-binding oxidoreductase [Engelhardtia mirabilis]|uniref:Ferredoxin--NAD(P)(+) reductase (Naphthalene dioxygenase ferredoxin-specific) n=1 Tax=Engelhardtia mirabilis TaxID=2528011 RepID=A0A518BSK8_9BACT|nr:Ferredoxin--NAD(P)(+) reductase (naphthalene dioxygenase ferredoxin-specific) [Planctomycetes bacterium Pla133]QDV04292.1 Ferredoxin--NAD(P)(+) reductase (naphthalene dioxygenase ferredoxin-specific) [Planctomycetes bacterium Pla86]
MSPGQIEVEGQRIELEQGETVLQGLERAGLDVASGCRAGTCTKCLLQAQDAPPPASQRGLRPTLTAQNFFLACQARPTGLLRLRGSRGPEPVRARVASIDHLTEDVARLRLTPDERFDYRPGQYLDVLHPGGESRSYSIASLPSDGWLELHVRRIPGGQVSGWLHELAVDAELAVRGPFGQCFHVADDDQRKLLLVGAGTGLAPLVGIARDALEQGHRGPIDLVHGGLEPNRLYLRDDLDRLARESPQLRVHHCVLRGATAREHEGPLDQVAIRLAGALAGARAFLCGDGEIVHLLRRSLFLAGLPSGEILADPFLPSKPALA